MSANSDRNEAGRPADENEDFESGLDYGAFASDEPDFPDDTLNLEREQRPSRERESSRSGSGEPDEQVTQAMPAARENQGTPGGEASGRRDEHHDAPTQNIARTGAGDAEGPNTTRSLDDVRTSRDSRSMDDTTSFTGAAAAGASPAGASSAGAADPRSAPRDTPSPSPATQNSQTGTGATAVTPGAQAGAGAAGAGAGAAAGTAAGAGTGSDDHPGRRSSGSSTAAYGSDESVTDADLDEEVARSKRGVSRFFQVLIAIFTPILLLVAAVRLVASPLFLWVAYHRPWLPDGAYTMDTEDRMVYGSYGTDFLTNFANSRYLSELAPGGEPLFTDGEVSHMVDVKSVVLWAMLIGVVLLVITLILALLLRAWRPGGVARGLFAGAWVTLGLIIAVAVLAIIDWQLFFAEFHRLLFADGTWTFPSDSTLIQLYPEQFWIDAGIAVVALTVLFALILLIATWPTRRRRARRAARLAEVHERRKAKLVDELNKGNDEHGERAADASARGRKRDRGLDRDQTTSVR